MCGKSVSHPLPPMVPSRPKIAQTTGSSKDRTARPSHVAASGHTGQLHAISVIRSVSADHLRSVSADHLTEINGQMVGEVSRAASDLTESRPRFSDRIKLLDIKRVEHFHPNTRDRKSGHVCSVNALVLRDVMRITCKEPVLIGPIGPVWDNRSGQQDTDTSGQRAQHGKPPSPTVDRFH